MKERLAFIWARIQAPLGTLVKAALVAALAIVVTWGPGVLDKTPNDWRLVLGIAIAAVAKVAYQWLDRNDTRYGRVKAEAFTVYPRD